VSTKPPKGEKPADTIRFQAAQLDMLYKRCDDLSAARGKAEADRQNAEKEKREISASRDRYVEQRNSYKLRAERLEVEVARLQGYINRVREAEGGPPAHTDRGPSIGDLDFTGPANGPDRLR